MPFDAELAKVSLSKEEPAKEKPRKADRKRKSELATWDGEHQEVGCRTVVVHLGCRSVVTGCLNCVLAARVGPTITLTMCDADWQQGS